MEIIYVKKSNKISEFNDKKVIVDNKQTYLMFEYKDEQYKFSMPILSDNQENETLTEIAVREIFWEIFARFSASKLGVRFVIQALLIFSLITFTFPFIESIISGFQYLLK